MADVLERLAAAKVAGLDTRQLKIELQQLQSERPKKGDVDATH